jgi:hypothetical protein
MKIPEQAVTLDQQQMDAFDRMAMKVGSTGPELVRRALSKIIAALEEAHKANDPVHGSVATSLPADGSAPSTVVQFHRKP